MKPFKIRCSAIGTFMGGTIGLTEKQQETLDRYFLREKEAETNPKRKLTSNMEVEKNRLIKESKSKELPQGAKTIVETWLQEQLYGRKKEFTSKQTDKGNLLEDDAIDLVVKELDLGWDVIKNETYFYSDYVHGTPDLLPDDFIIDTKCSWTCFTFPLFGKELDKTYWWQGQGYMHLTGRQSYKVIYCLVDMPEYLLLEELRKERWKISNAAKSDDVIYSELKEKYTYSHLPIELRMKVYDFEYEPRQMEVVIERVKLARDYVKQLIEGNNLSGVIKKMESEIIELKEVNS